VGNARPDSSRVAASLFCAAVRATTPPDSLEPDGTVRRLDEPEPDPLVFDWEGGGYAWADSDQFYLPTSIAPIEPSTVFRIAAPNVRLRRIRETGL
jgi:hypothetical protein